MPYMLVGFSAPNRRQVILDDCCSQATFLILPVGPKLSRADVVARITGLHNRREVCDE